MPFQGFDRARTFDHRLVDVHAFGQRRPCRYKAWPLLVRPGTVHLRTAADELDFDQADHPVQLASSIGRPSMSPCCRSGQSPCNTNVLNGLAVALPQPSSVM